MRTLLSKFSRNNRGIALLEFAIVFPFLFLLIFGGIEVARYILILQKLEKAVYTLTDIVGQSTPATAAGSTGEISATQIDNVMNSFDNMMGIYASGERQGIIVSSVLRRPGENASDVSMVLRWQRKFMGPEVMNSPSIVTGQAGQNTTRTNPAQSCLPAPFNAEINTQLQTALVGENMIVGEVFYKYQPLYAYLLGGASPTAESSTDGFALQPQILTRRMFIHPRLGDLVDLPPAHPVSAGPCP